VRYGDTDFAVCSYCPSYDKGKYAVDDPRNDATTSLDTMNNIICATVTSFLAFGIFEPAVVPVRIDIKPGSFPNSIKLSSQGNIPVAILSSSTFNAPANVDKTSLTFGATGNEKSFAFCDLSPRPAS
jgi:hypothetical protein